MMEQLFQVSEQDQVWWSNFLIQWASLSMMEQLFKSVSKFKYDGATFQVSEQVQVWWSNFSSQRATLHVMEQLSRSPSKIVCDGATFQVSEQIPWPSSKFIW